jgi:hypothetical protein
MNKQNSTLKKAMLEALEKSLGVVTTAAKLAGIDRGSHYNWFNEDLKYRNAVNELENLTLDYAESQLHKQIKNGNTSATIFFLKTKGKKRGYIERQEIEHLGAMPSMKVSKEAKDKIDEILNNEY